jgi:hypothetical protein
MLGSWSTRARGALAGALLSGALWTPTAAAVPIEAPALTLARRGVQLTIGATRRDSTHVTVIDAETGEILQQRWYVLAHAGPPLELETVRPAQAGHVTLEVQVAGQAPERVQVWLLPDWTAVIPLLFALAVLIAWRRLASARGRQPHDATGSRP